MKSRADTSRLFSLDVMRGITIAGMILVNNPGNWSAVFTPLKHAEWDGLTPTDLVFPFFIFIMGISMYLSYAKFNFKLSSHTFTKFLRRSIWLFLIGLSINWLGVSLYQFNLFLSGENMTHTALQCFTDLDTVRIPGVLQRLALVSFFSSLILLTFNHKYINYFTTFLLLVYGSLILISRSTEPGLHNLISRVDTWIFGTEHIYTKTIEGINYSFDPEGLLSTLPAIAQTMMGVWAGNLISRKKDNSWRMQQLLLYGTILLMGGYLLSYGIPINKSLWSVSFVLVSSGWAALLLGLLSWIIDVKAHRSWGCFFESFGVNPMFVYLFANVLSITLINIRFTYDAKIVSLKGYIVSEWLEPTLGTYTGSLAYAIIFIFVSWCLAYCLHKKKIYIKL